MKKILTVVAALLVVAVSAQNLHTFKSRLAAPVVVDSLTTVRQTVQVTELGDAQQITTRAASATRPQRVSGYRIMLFMSNSQSARTEAFAACDSLAVRMPYLPTYVSYDNPYFKVTVGNCTSQEEALILLERIKPTFPKAFIMRENIPLEELTR